MKKRFVKFQLSERQRRALFLELTGGIAEGTRSSRSLKTQIRGIQFMDPTWPGRPVNNLRDYKIVQQYESRQKRGKLCAKEVAQKSSKANRGGVK